MTNEQIAKWAEDRINLQRNYTWAADNRAYIARFETGETYEYKSEDFFGGNERETKIFINGKLENVSRYRWHNFGWKLIKEESAA